MDIVKKRGASTKNTLAKNNAKLGMVVVHYRIYNKYSKGWILCLGKLIGGVPIPPHTEHYSHRGVQHSAPDQLVLVLVLVCNTLHQGMASLYFPEKSRILLGRYGKGTDRLHVVVR